MQCSQLPLSLLESLFKKRQLLIYKGLFFYEVKYNYFMMDQEYINFINSQLALPYYQEVMDFLQKEIASEKIIYPKEEQRFKAFAATPFNKMKIVIFGQDPYHSPNVADGLAFSTQTSKTPKSLANIFKELKNEYPDVTVNNNNLEPWAKQGVLLLNTSLSVEAGKPNSHAKIGWNIFIENLLKYLNDHKEFLIFILWGNEAKKLKPLIADKFHILESTHPSPFSFYKGFLGNNHFKKANKIILENNLEVIDWNL